MSPAFRKGNLERTSESGRDVGSLVEYESRLAVDDLPNRATSRPIGPHLEAVGQEEHCVGKFHNVLLSHLKRLEMERRLWFGEPLSVNLV